MSEFQEPLFTEIKFTGSVFVPTTELADEWTMVMRGSVDKIDRILKQGEVCVVARVKADRAMRIEMEGVIDAANVQLLDQVTSFLEAADYPEGAIDPDIGEVL